MIIHLLRHADAENGSDSDFLRNLTPKGHLQAAQVAQFLANNAEPIGVIVTSPYLRALQTAQAVAKKFPAISLVEDQRLRCGMSPQSAIGIFKEYNRFGNILLVGHQPDLGILASFLTTRDQSLNIEFEKASLLTLDLHQPAPASSTLLSYVRVSQMR